MPSLVEIVPVVLEKRRKCEKFTTTITTTMGNGPIMIIKAHYSLVTFYFGKALGFHELTVNFFS